ncbi:uncharacterized protein LOC132601755 [Lycium barbarum]|uniref:uncharacterized protein LOC132601755 n=1 Tax=Lycium barbarum TaxID=112863 RepID=UPI00293F1373|nr:uncharacterized protein LOC132601755 [Lycium barbarum]
MALILYVVGDSPSIGTITRFIGANWRFSYKPRIYYHNDGYFVVLFNSNADKEEMLFSGPHTINNKPLILRAWNPDFNFGDEVLRTIPLWIRFPNLPMNCWGGHTLSWIGSVLGCPIYADECMTSIERVSYARILVEMDVTRALPYTVKLQDPEGNIFIQEMEYDWKPSFCPKCLKIEHVCKPAPERKEPANERPRGPRPRANKTWVPNKAGDQIIQVAIVAGDTMNVIKDASQTNNQVPPAQEANEAMQSQPIERGVTQAVSNYAQVLSTPPASPENVKQRKDATEPIRKNAKHTNLARVPQQLKPNTISQASILSPLMDKINREILDMGLTTIHDQRTKGGTTNSQNPYAI